MKKSELKNIIKEEIENMLGGGSEKIFSVSFTNEFNDEELVVYVKGAANEEEALEKVRVSDEFRQYQGEFTTHLKTLDLNAGEYGLDPSEEELFKGDLAFFDIEPLDENK